MIKKKKAVVLFSGGLDSTTVMAIAKNEGFLVYGITIDYGQRHSNEIKAAKLIAKKLGTEKHIVIKIDLRKIGGSALTGDIDVPKMGQTKKSGIPTTYVHARNTIFLSIALAWAEVLGAFDIFIGVNSIDYSGYPDCRPEYIESFEKTANLATRISTEGKQHINIRAPLINMTKADVIRKGTELGIDYSITHSCYDPSAEGLACGQCHSCLLRKKGFSKAEMPDPTKYML